MGVAAFVYDDWITLYPELSGVSAQRAALLFQQAGLYLNNTDSSLVADVGARQQYLYMITAHLAALGGAGAAGGIAGAVGAVSRATEGSVTVERNVAALPGSGAWFAQTGYGFAYWAATAQYRTMQYRPGPQPYLGTGRYGGTLRGRY